MAILNEIKAGVVQMCAQHHVRALFAFGSVVKGRLKANSDVDFLVDIDNNDPLAYADDYFGLKTQLEQLLNRKVDLLEQKALKNPYLLKEINATKVLVYGK
jgi:predicted nucleotidyltransferase